MKLARRVILLFERLLELALRRGEVEIRAFDELDDDDDDELEELA